MAPQTELIDETGRVVFRGTQSPGGGSSPVLVARAYLDNDTILALPTTPVELAPSPGPGKMIWPQTGLIYCDTSGGSYSNISEGTELGPSLGVPGDILNYLFEVTTVAQVSTLLGASQLSLVPFGPQAIVAGGEFTGNLVGPFVFGSGAPVEDVPLILSAPSNDGDFTEGDPANFMVVTVTYSIIDLTP